MNKFDGFEYHKKLADEGNPFSAYIVSVHYELGIEVEPNEELQEKYLYISAKGENPEGCYKLGELYLKRNEITTALYWFSVSASLNEPQAQNAIGLLCENKLFNKPDYSQCVYWYSLSAKNGYDEGQYNLARMYECGYGLEVDVNKAFALYEKASAENYPPALLKLAEYYENGIIVKIDKLKAGELRKLAEENSRS